MDTRPIAYLTIIPRGRMTSYRLCDGAGRLLWATRAYSTDEGRDGARARLRVWRAETGYRVELDSRSAAPALKRRA